MSVLSSGHERRSDRNDVHRKRLGFRVGGSTGCAAGGAGGGGGGDWWMSEQQQKQQL